MQLGDLGADVIKVERPGTGDQTRGWHPPRFGDGEDAVSAYFASVNRNKRSITVDLETERGREVVRELAGDADVLVEHPAVGPIVMARIPMHFSDAGRPAPPAGTGRAHIGGTG